MARTSGDVVDNNFSKGVISEATNLNFPENAATDARNVRFDHTGKVFRRGGFTLEATQQDGIIGNSLEDGYNIYNWQNPGNLPDTTYTVLAKGGLLEIYSSDTNGNISDRAPLFTQTFANTKGLIRFSSIRGDLIVTNAGFDPKYVELVDGVFNVVDINIRIRDFTGLETDFQVNEYPRDRVGGSTTGVPNISTEFATEEHLYNLLNQGWEVGNVLKSLVGRGELLADNPLNWYRHINKHWPSNGEFWWGFKNSLDTFDPNFGTQSTPTTLAPKGYYIIDPFNTDRSAVSGVGNFPPNVTNSRPTVSAVFAGRVWFSGVSDGDYTQTIFFSQIITPSSKEYGNCYQRNDPTSDTFFDLLKNDGGSIDIIDMGTVVNLFPLKRALIVFSTNGIWAITGNEALGFTATDFSVEYIGSTQALSFESFVNVGGLPVWWNSEAIYALAQSDGGVNFNIKNMTEDTIDTIFTEIPRESKRFAKGVFNVIEQEVQWVYSNSEIPDMYDTIMTMDTQTGAFSFWDWDTSNFKLKDVFLYRGPSTDNTFKLVVDTDNENDGPQFVEAQNTQVINLDSGGTVDNHIIKYIFTDNTNDYVLEESKDVYKDFTFNPSRETHFKSYFDTGYRVRGDGNKKSQVNWIVVWSEVIPENSCYVQALWDYSNSGNSGDWSRPQQACGFAGNREYTNRRLKIRGSGYSVQFRYQGFEDKPFCITGWSSFETSNATV